MRNSETATTNVFFNFYFYLFIQKTFYFVREYLWKYLIYIFKFVVQSSVYQVIGNRVIKKTPTLIKIRISLVNAVLRPKILGNRLGILTQILIVIDFFYICTSEKYLQFRKKTFSQEKIQLALYSVKIFINLHNFKLQCHLH